MEKILIDWEQTDDYINIPLEYRFVDKVEVVPGKEAWGMKAVSSQDWYFRIHFPNNPVMPGVLLMETMQQTGLFILKTLPETEEGRFLFQGCENMRMYSSVRPGEIIRTYVILKSYHDGIADFHGEVKLCGEQNERLACSMEFTLVSQNKLLKVF